MLGTPVKSSPTSTYNDAFKVTAKDRVFISGESSYWQIQEKPGIFVNKSARVGIKTNTPLEEIHLNGILRGGESHGGVKIQTDYGYLKFGAFNGSYMHFYSDQDKFYFQRRLIIDEGIISSYNEDLKLQTAETTRLQFNLNDGSATFYGHQVAFVGANSQTNILLESTNGTGNFKKIVVGDLQITSGTHTDAIAEIDGKVVCKKLIVTQSNWADFVFDADYNLPSLFEVEKFIKENRHLPSVPSESEVLENGNSLGEMDALLLQKIEELTLYLIDLDKKNQELEQQINALKK